MLTRLFATLPHPFHCWTHLPYVAGLSTLCSYEGIRRLYSRVLSTLSTTRFTGRHEKCPLFPGSGYSRVRPVFKGISVISWTVLCTGRMLTVLDGSAQPKALSALNLLIINGFLSPP